MSRNAISHRKPRGKRRGAWAWAARRFGALVVTLGALTTASWLAPRFFATATPTIAPATIAQRPVIVIPPTPIELADVDVRLDLQARVTPIVAYRRPRTGVPLDALTGAEPDGFEVLSAAELASISQARD